MEQPDAKNQRKVVFLTTWLSCLFSNLPGPVPTVALSSFFAITDLKMGCQVVIKHLTFKHQWSIV